VLDGGHTAQFTDAEQVQPLTQSGSGRKAVQIQARFARWHGDVLHEGVRSRALMMLAMRVLLAMQMERVMHCAIS
jgi:hypothetical protein